ncbi:MAG: hypothetical protein WAM85_17055 [Terracidiphilus sp.]
MHKLCAGAFAVLILYSLAVAADLNFSKRRIELPYTPDAASADRDYHSLLGEIEHLNAEEKESDCRSERFRNARESGTPWHSCRFFIPFPLADQVAVDENIKAIYSWAPAEAGTAAAQQVERWQVQADKGTPYECNGAVCSVIVRVLGHPNGEDVLAACKVIADANGAASGAPWHCVPIAIVARSSIWTKIVTGYTEIRNRTLGLPDFDLAVISRDSIPDVSSFLAGAENALSSAPLALSPKLEVKGTEVGTLFGTSQYVPSQVLQAYRPRLREMATVRVEAFGEKQNGLMYIRLSVSTTVLVNTLASTDPDDWHRPNPAQEGDYINAVQANLKKYLEQSCRQPLWRTSHVITCGLSNDAPLPAWALQ